MLVYVFVDALASFFSSTDLGMYWIYMFVGAGVATCIFIIFDNINR